jgi:FkbM family methyltransferase
MPTLNNLLYRSGLTWRRMTGGPISPHEKWRLDKGDQTHRVDYPLTEDSIVLDVGAYRGDWAAEIAARYNPWLYLFEPITTNVELLRQRFHCNSKVVIFPFALGDGDGTALLSDAADATRVTPLGRMLETVNERSSIEVEIRDSAAIVAPLCRPEIDLIKLNVESAEYEIVPRLYGAGLLPLIRFFQIQFHPFPEGYEEMYSQCRIALGKSHQLNYEYPFVWEGWSRKSRETQ